MKYNKEKREEIYFKLLEMIYFSEYIPYLCINLKRMGYHYIEDFPELLEFVPENIEDKNSFGIEGAWWDIFELRNIEKTDVLPEQAVRITAVLLSIEMLND